MTWVERDLTRVTVDVIYHSGLVLRPLADIFPTVRPSILFRDRQAGEFLPTRFPARYPNQVDKPSMRTVQLTCVEPEKDRGQK